MLIAANQSILGRKDMAHLKKENPQGGTFRIPLLGIRRMVEFLISRFELLLGCKDAAQVWTCRDLTAQPSHCHGWQTWGHARMEHSN